VAIAVIVDAFFTEDYRSSYSAGLYDGEKSNIEVVMAML
jgi:hypothetical protein